MSVAPHRHGREHVAGGLVQLPEVGPYHLVQAGRPQVELEPGLDRIRACFGQRTRALVGAQQFGREQRVAGRQVQDAAQDRARPAARVVEHQALDHHRAHRRQPQVHLRLLDQHGQRLTGRVRPRGDQQHQRQVPAGPHQPPQQRERGRVEVVRVVGPQHHRTVGAELVDAIERRVTRIRVAGNVPQERPGDGEGVVAPALQAGHAADAGRAGLDRLQDRAGQEGLADARRALQDDARAGGHALLDHAEDEVADRPLDGGPVGRARPATGGLRHIPSISRPRAGSRPAWAPQG